MEFFLLFILLIFCGFFALLNFAGLPGNWLMLFAVVLFKLFSNDMNTFGVSWFFILVMVSLAIFGEIIEFLASAAGVTQGGSKRGALLAMIGSFLGSAIGATLGSALPVFGTLFGLIFGGCLGAMTGAMLGEHSLGKDMATQWRIGKAAFWGRFFGTFAKIGIGAINFALLILALVFSAR